MGIRFRCHHCQYELHVKDFQGGKRGKCPKCTGKFRIPTSDSDFSSALQENTSVADAMEPAEELIPKAESNGTEITSVTDSPDNRHGNAIGEGAAASDHSAQTEPRGTVLTTPPIGSLAAPKSAPATWRAFRDAAGAQWHVRPPSGGQYGPANSEAFTQWIMENRVTADSLVWSEGWPEWLVAADVFNEFFSTSPPQAKAGNLTGVAGALTGRASPIQQARKLKKKRADKRYRTMVVALAIIAVLLVIALIVVVVRLPKVG